jgi:opacity protein-like surface antigen
MKCSSFLVCMILSLSLAIPVMGQDYYLGVTGGMNIAKMKITGDGDEQNVDALNRYGVGGIIGYKFKENMALQLRPLYLQKGGTLIQDDDSPNVDFLMSFIELDLSLKVTFGEQLRPYIIGGPSIGFLMSSEVELDVEGNKITGEVTDISKKTEFSLGIGAGLEYVLGNGVVFLEGRYLHGLNNLNKGGPIDLKYNGMVIETENISPEDEYKNRGWQIMAGFLFPIGSN